MFVGSYQSYRNYINIVADNCTISIYTIFFSYSDFHMKVGNTTLFFFFLMFNDRFGRSSLKWKISH